MKLILAALILSVTTAYADDYVDVAIATNAMVKKGYDLSETYEVDFGTIFSNQFDRCVIVRTKQTRDSFSGITACFKRGTQEIGLVFEASPEDAK